MSSLGREIANILFDKNYNKTKAENKINTIGIDHFHDKMLSDSDKKKYEDISKSKAGEILPLLSNYNSSFIFDGEKMESLNQIFEKVNILLGKKVISETLDRLKDDQDLNNWVKQGFDLHKIKEEKNKCLFCQNLLEKDFFESLSKHFSQDYDDLQKAINLLKVEVNRLKINEIELKNDTLYPDLKANYSIEAKSLNLIIVKHNTWIDSVSRKLTEKYDNPLSMIGALGRPEDFAGSYNAIISELNKIIIEHNEKNKNHMKVVILAKEKLELHSLAVALSQQNYKKITEDLRDLELKEKLALENLNKSILDIAELEKQNSNIGKAIIEINKHLREFFGREEIQLDLDASKKGYTIRRDSQPAKNLSEGEKTAIAFSYFIVKVGEGDFDKSKGIIFIDDPISSFDSNFIYHSFSLINNHFRDVGQLFISTHNFQLFNLIKDWLIHKNNKTKRDNIDTKSKGGAEKPIPSEFFMVENFMDSDKRKAKLVSLDKTLRNYKSEYHFLFSKLNDFSNKEDTQYEDFYTIGNMARRFFDIFADFKVPTTGDPKSKMDSLVRSINEKEEKISLTDANKAYKLVNEFSHNYDPTSTIEHKDKSESRDAISVLLRIVKESDEKHFLLLEKTCRPE